MHPEFFVKNLEDWKSYVDMPKNFLIETAQEVNKMVRAFRDAHETAVITRKATREKLRNRRSGTSSWKSCGLKMYRRLG